MQSVLLPARLQYLFGQADGTTIPTRCRSELSWAGPTLAKNVVHNRLSFLHHKPDSLEDGNVPERISMEADEIRLLADFYGANLVFQCQQP